MKNPKWHRDEVILALDLYFKLTPSQMHARNEKVIELSSLLNKMPIHNVKPINIKFRNPNGVGMKLTNFLAIDPNYSGKGLGAYSKLDEKVFFEFFENKESLAQTADSITTVVQDDKIGNELYKISESEDAEEIQTKEGKVLYKLHKFRERNPKINKKKKDLYLEQHGKLDCEVCGFDFKEKYGDLGLGYIECHHRIPLNKFDGETTTQLTDLALVCANCHRMLHRRIDTLAIDELKRII